MFDVVHKIIAVSILEIKNKIRIPPLPQPPQIYKIGGILKILGVSRLEHEKLFISYYLASLLVPINPFTVMQDKYRRLMCLAMA